MINIYHTRKILTDISCVGSFEFMDEKYYVLEDPPRDEKIKGITGIPCGVYELKIKEVVTPLTQVYRDRYDWFEYHIEITDVKTHKCVYQHIGNYAENSDGCQLIGLGKAKDMVTNSTKGFKRYYQNLYPILKKGEERVYLHVEECFE